MSEDHVTKELSEHRGNLDEPLWLNEVGVIESADTPYTIEDSSEWHCPGSESYIMDFTVATAKDRLRLIAKSCIKFAPLETVNEWMGRRQTLKENSISVPKLYSVHRATYIEEFIDLDLKTAVQNSELENAKLLRDRFVWTYRQLFIAGFRPMSIHDARSRGDDVVLIDYGSDLGSSNYGKAPFKEEQVLTNALKAFVSISGTSLK